AASRSRRRARLLGDPTGRMSEQAHTDGGGRFTRGFAAAAQLLDAPHYRTLLPALGCIQQTILPGDRDAMAGVRGPLWLAVGIGSRGVAIYVNARWGSVADQWVRIKHCMNALGGSADAVSLANNLEQLGALPNSLRFEGTTHEDARVKLYW